MKLIKWFWNWYKWQKTGEYKSYQCDCLKYKGKWNFKNEIGLCCIRAKDHLGDHK